MIDLDLIQEAVRARLITLVVATTGSTSLSATSTGYARASGSFLSDGFRAGMEIVAEGFDSGGGENNGARMIEAVDALTITCSDTVEESAGSGRSLVAGLPTGRAWENEEFEPVAGWAHVREEVLPGPAKVTSSGPNGFVHGLPTYVAKVYVPEGVGVYAANKYMAALAAHFYPHLGLTLENGDVVRVRGDVMPFAGQLLPAADKGFRFRAFSIPLWIMTTTAVTSVDAYAALFEDGSAWLFEDGSAMEWEH